MVERGHRAFRHGALDAALDRLMMQPERPTHRKKRRVFPIGALSISTSPYPNLRATIQSPAATLP